MKPFRFGIVAGDARSGAEWKDLARRAEAAGYSSLLLPDISGPVLSPFAALATAAAVTSTLNVGNWVLAGDFRNPVLLAREAATLDLLSDGRFELGFGAGRGDNDYAALGLGATPSPGVRLQRLSESLEIITRLFGGEPVTFDGRYHHIQNATLYPVPRRKSLPILIAAGGPKAVALAGKVATTVALGSGSRDAFLQQVARLHDAAGARFEDIELASIVWVVPDDNPAARQRAEAMIQRLTDRSIDILAANRAPNLLVGSPESMVDELEERRASLGLSYIVVDVRAAEWFARVVARLVGK